MITFADGFSGFGGVQIAARMAGFTPLWAIEKDPAIAEVHRINLDGTLLTADMLTVDPRGLPTPHVQHWSPPCINASLAKKDGEETELDRLFAGQIIRFTEAHRPPVVTLENVFNYRNFQAFQGGKLCEGLVPALMRLGYQVRWWHVNFADYGVPQLRKRLIMVAARGFVPQLPPATHQEPGQGLSQLSMFSQFPNWIGWYAAIEDLLPTLPESEFAPWQLARLPTQYQDLLVGNQQRDGVISHAHAAKPAMTVTTSGLKYRAFLMGGAGNTNFADAKPGNGVRYANEPAGTVTTHTGGGTMPRAFVISGTNSNSWVNEDGIATVKDRSDPIFTVTSNIHKGLPRAYLEHGKVVKMTPRALARFQTFPDSFQLPANARLAAQGIGNAVPPVGMVEFFKQIGRQLR